MPYVRKAERERALWMTLREAATYIQEAERCDSVEALRQLKMAIADQQIAVRWADATDAKDQPATNPAFWQEVQLLLVQDGFAPDPDWNILRPLLVHRETVTTIWSHPTPETTDTVADHVAVTVARKGGRPSVRNLVWDSLTRRRDGGDKLESPYQRLAEQVAADNGTDLDAKGWDERTIVQHVSDWFRHENVWETLAQMQTERILFDLTIEKLAQIVAERNGRKIDDPGWMKKKIELYVGDWLTENSVDLVRK